MMLMLLYGILSTPKGYGQAWDPNTNVTTPSVRGSNTGIGVNNPQKLLHLSNGSYSLPGSGCTYLFSLPTIRLSATTNIPPNPVPVDYCPKNLSFINWDIEASTGRLGFLEGTNERITMRAGAEGNVGIGYTTPNFRLSLGTLLANTKIALYENNGADVYGLGIQGNQFRLHIANVNTRFTFLNSPNGDELMNISGNKRVTINGDPANASALLVNNCRIGQLTQGNFADFQPGDVWTALGSRLPPVPNLLQGINVNGLRTQWGRYGANFGVTDDSSDPLIKHALISWQDLDVTGTANVKNRLIFGLRDNTTVDFFEVATFTNKGFLGVGTATPGSLISARGNMSVGSSYANSSAPSDGLIVEGKVGIGLDNPTHTLQLGDDDAAKTTTSVWTTTSDRTLKKDIKDFTLGLETLNQIRPVTFKFTGEGGIKDADKENVGIIAQEMQQIPGLGDYTISVNQNGRLQGKLAYNANAVIYVLINSVKQLSKELEELKAEGFKGDRFFKSDSVTKGFDIVNQNKLYQNRPNPSDGNTVIDYEFEVGQTAQIMIFDLLGTFIRSFKVVEKGKGSIQLRQGEFKAGMYNYAMLVDGDIVESKKMVISY